YVEGRWQPTGEFLLLLGTVNDLSCVRQAAGRKIQLICEGSGEKDWYRRDVEGGPPELADAYHQQWAQLGPFFTDGGMQASGWLVAEAYRNESPDFSEEGSPYFFFEGDIASELLPALIWSESGEVYRERHYYVWSRFLPGSSHLVELVPSPLPWPG